jgi:predicted protein tyrosine phosphatase
MIAAAMVDKPPRLSHRSPQNGPNQILSYLYIGSQRDSNRPTVCRHNFTHILSIGCPPLNKNTPVSRHEFPLSDSVDASITDVVERVVAVINEAKKRKGGAKILVHCHSGKSRSAAVVAAYLMREESVGLDEALAMLKLARPLIQPNEGFMRQLEDWEADRCKLEEISKENVTDVQRPQPA